MSSRLVIAVLVTAFVTSNCSAEQINSAVGTAADTTKYATSLLIKAYPSEVTTTEEVSEDTGKSYKFKWMKTASETYNKVSGGRETIRNQEHVIAMLQAELRQVKAKVSFSNVNAPTFSMHMESLCHLYDAGGIKQSLEGDDGL